MLIILLVVELLLFIVVIIVVFVVIQLNHGPLSQSARHAHYTARGRAVVIIVVVAANL